MKKDAAPQRTQFIMMFFAFAFGMILSNLLDTQSKNQEASSEEEILFVYRGIEKTIEHVSEPDRLEIEALNQKKIKIIEKAALRQYFLDEAKSQDVSVETVAERVLKWVAVSEEEVHNFYSKNKDDIKKPLFEVKPQIQRSIEIKRAISAREALLETLKKEGELAILPLN